MTDKETKKLRLCERHGWTRVCPNLCFEMCDDKHTDRCKFYTKPDEPPEQIIIRLEAELERQKFILDKFAGWWSEQCPYSEHLDCTGGGKTEHDEEMATEDEEVRVEFDSADCDVTTQGYCWMIYWGKQFDKKGIGHDK